MLSMKTINLCDSGDWSAERSHMKYLKEINKICLVFFEQQNTFLELKVKILEALD